MSKVVVVDKARLLRRAIVISWITLALCFVVKIFGGNFFEIMCNNPNYKALCEYAETHLWLDLILSISSSMFCQSLYILAILQKYKFEIGQFIATFISVIFSCVIKILNQYIGLVADVWTFIFLPMIFIKKDYKRYLHILVALLLTWAFQILSLLVKNLSFGFIDDSIFVVMIYMIDLYIMCFLYYLYRNYKKEQELMGRFWGWFAGKPVDKLKEMKVKREQKIAKLNEEIKAIEEAIKAQSNK
jgi:hypothetical protein